MRVSKHPVGSTALVVVLILAVAPIVKGSAREPDPQGIAGMYICRGVLPDGAEYTGSVDIVRHGATWQLLWTLSTGERYLGVGVASDDVLAVTYFAEIPGLVVYDIVRGDGRLELQGRWTTPAADGHVAGENLIRVGETTGALHFKVVPHRKVSGRRRRSAVSQRPPAPPATHWTAVECRLR